MNILIASDFLYEYELYKTDKPQELKKHITKLLNGEDITDKGDFELLGYQDTMTTDEALEIADETWYISDIIDE